MNQLDMFGRNMFFLLGAILFVGVGSVVVVASWTGLRAWMWQRRMDREAKERDQRKYRPDGAAYPPVGRGICDHCSGAFNKVYYMPTGERLCPSCYAEAEGDSGSSRADESLASEPPRLRSRF